MRMLNGLVRGDVIRNKYMRGMYITLGNLFRFGGMSMEDRQPNPKSDSSDIDVSISFWKFGIHLHLVKAKENICQDRNNPKSR